MAKVREAQDTIKSMIETMESSEKAVNSLIREYLEEYIFPYAKSLGYDKFDETNATLRNPMYSVGMENEDENETIYVRVMVGSNQEEPVITLSSSKDPYAIQFEELDIDNPENSFKNWMAKLHS